MGIGICCGVSESNKDAAEDAKSRSSKRSLKDKSDDDIKYDDIPHPGISLINNTFNLDQDLKLLQEKYKDKYKPLLERKMVDIACDNINKSEYDITSNSITVMQFNMLADGLSTAYNMKQSAKTFLNVDKECLRWTYRGVRVVEEILRHNADIIAVEECDHIEFIMKYLSAHGYNHFFQEKKTSAITKVQQSIIDERGIQKEEALSMNNDGSAIIYKQDTFEVNENDVEYVDSEENEAKVNALAVPLKVKKNINQEILFIVTHLKSTKSQEGEELRVKQANYLLKEAVENAKKLPIVLCCDLNANPVVNKKGYKALCYESITDEHNLKFQSVYKLANGTEPKYTTCKAREDGIDKHVLDYIFIRDGKWNVTKILTIPEMGDDATKLIPNWWYPSDHFCIAAQLTWK